MNTDELKSEFERIFQRPAQGCARAPGRVNLIGEFTDYNLGYVMPAALEFCTTVLYRKRDDNQVVVYSHNYPGESDSFSVGTEIVAGESQWGNYVRGCAATVQADGGVLGGLDILIASDVPQGAGLSSSAALEVSVIGALNHAFGLGYSLEKIATLGQSAENDFMGCSCGIMDQLISAKGQAGHALLIDCRSLESNAVAMPDNLALVIINSNYPRKLVDSEYNQRRQDCETAAQKLGVETLRDADLATLEQAKDSLSADEYKRAHHIITENARVLATVGALQSGDIKALAESMTGSHQSLQRDFEVTVPATDTLVEICNSVLGERGVARMTGGGFGGAIVCFCPPEDVELVKIAVAEQYPQKCGLEADIYVCKTGAGLQVESLKGWSGHGNG